MNKPDTYISDNPISLRDEDHFQRYDYAKRIADTISTRNSTDNIVFGLYGKWGEGKSSVLKFIENELDKKKTLQVHFNPWRYNDEDSILLSFFEEIAEALDKQLKSKSDIAKESFKKYVFITKVFGFDLDGASGLFSDRDVEHFKSKTEDILKKSKKKLVVFIDDIDRLDKDELFTLFRLIKLTANFSNTVYILSFDKEMVAKAIGQRFGDGNHQDGSSFLEKIIQIPIELPSFRRTELRGYALGLVNEVLMKNNVQLSESEQNRYVVAFDGSLYEAIKTPRSAIRYRNALEFSIPLMQGEVDIIDFLIFEGLKIFYPEHVDNIKTHPAFFLFNNVIGSKILYEISKPEIDDNKKQLEKLNKSLSDSAQKGLQITLEKLFPKVKSLYESNYSFSSDQLEKYRLDKRICSAEYFERFLSYSLAKNEISDVEFKSFIESLKIDSITNISSVAREFIFQSSIDDFMGKITLVEKELNWVQVEKLIEFIFRNSDLLEDDYFSFFDFNSSIRKATYFITRQLKEIQDSSETQRFLSEQIKHIKNIKFLFNFLRVGIFDKNVSDGLFDEVQIKSIYQTSIDHTLKTLTDGEYLFDKYPILSREIMLFWIKIDIQKSGEHLKKYLSSENGNVVTVLKSFVGLGYVTSSNGDTSTNDTYIIDFDQETYDRIEKINCEDEIFRAINDKFSSDELFDNELYLDTKRQGRNTEINLVKQFLHFYQKDKIN